jgi:hypothetical protein
MKRVHLAILLGSYILTTSSLHSAPITLDYPTVYQMFLETIWTKEKKFFPIQNNVLNDNQPGSPLHNSMQEIEQSFQKLTTEMRCGLQFFSATNTDTQKSPVETCQIHSQEELSDRLMRRFAHLHETMSVYRQLNRETAWSKRYDRGDVKRLVHKLREVAQRGGFELKSL